MPDTDVNTLDILLFTSGNFWWGVDVYFVQFVKWGIRGKDLKPLKPTQAASILGIPPALGLEDQGQFFPAIFLAGASEDFDLKSFQGTAIFLGHHRKNFVVLADEIVGTETLKVPGHIRSLPEHLKPVFSGKNIWAVADIRGNLVYLFEPPTD
ncbi:MAG: hypothetical protein GXO76_14560 [Calditrichaeota bacterium]|nr:hypothetical protein [Calditrichota bacterium]